MSLIRYLDNSGIAVPADISDRVADVETIVPNLWNPNKMDPFMKDKLRLSITKDGFNLPIFVRPISAATYRPDYDELVDKGVKWEIVDGEHRWTVGSELGMKKIPFINLGPINDEKAKEITIKANSLRGEFDSIRLAQVIKDIVDAQGKEYAIEVLPNTPERIDALLSVLHTDFNQLQINDPNTPAPAASDPAASSKDRPSDAFKTFDGSTMKFEHKCPRCGFEFDDKKTT